MRLRALSPRHCRVHRTHWLVRSVGLVTVGVLAVGPSAVAAISYRADSNMSRHNTNRLLPAPPPVDPAAGKSLNILLIGSDDRSGENEIIGGAAEGVRSDTTIIMHISSDRRRIEMVSIPRDSLVTIPACTTTRGTTKPARNAMFNNAFAVGWDVGGDMASAVACTINTVQTNTGLRIDHSIVVDFAGFQQMVDAVGGVNLCLDRPMKDAHYTGLDLDAGPQRLNGVQALQFARARHIVGTDGSDTSRIDRQQQLLAGLAHEVLSKNVFTSTRELLRFVQAVTKSLSMDTALSWDTIVGLAYSLRHVDTSKIVFTTIPFDPVGNRVRWSAQADAVWAAMATDRSVADVLNPPAGKDTPGPQPAQLTSVEDVEAARQVCAA